MAAPVVVAPAINLQHMDLPEGNEDVAAVLQTSTQRWLNAAEWSILYNNHNLFPESNSFTIPIEVEGLYRVDNRFNQDSNTWRNTSAPSTCKMLSTSTMLGSPLACTGLMMMGTL
ncbi:hypothetical protein ISN45_At01g025180 [Arabidopsis thaliana x Arabidopsis arenosa]|uniref:Uncharacterized protein n=1 Tax=Arabidopsis thaliana x Arabidopsis arenosa TaxID=1240361 RepID=A0A8T2GJE1_9BRAS|nr:hypothetical protein ISN45_At01g025180 [Arabidopsis thaliana x Arabidopsis arenosa]